MDEKCTQLWEKLSAALKPHVSPDTFKRWFSAVQLIGATENTLTFRVPNNIYQFWIESNHMTALQAAIVSACGGPRTVKFSLPSDGSAGDEEPVLDAVKAVEVEEPAGPSAKQANALGLNPRNTF